MANPPEYISGFQFLQTPGPSNTPARILQAMARPVIDHRSPQFAELGKKVWRTEKTSCRPLLALLQTLTGYDYLFLHQVLKGSQEIFESGNDPVIIFPSSGHGVWYVASNLSMPRIGFAPDLHSIREAALVNTCNPGTIIVPCLYLE